MNYFKRHIGDYHKKAGRLTMLQHGAYTLLLDACYDREKFPTLDEALDWTWASSEQEVEAVKFVLRKFFVKMENGTYMQHRIQDELENYQERCDKNAKIAREREENKRKKREERESKTDDNKRNVDDKARNVQIEHETSTTEHEQAPNHKPLTTNHKPLTIKDKATALVNYWNDNRPSGCSVKVKTWLPKVTARLKNYDEADIKEAMNFILNSQWHIQHNEVSIKNAISSDERLEYCLEKSRNLTLNLDDPNENSKSNIGYQAHTQAQNFDTGTTTGYSNKLDADAEAYYRQQELEAQQGVDRVGQDAFCSVESLVQGQDAN